MALEAHVCDGGASSEGAAGTSGAAEAEEGREASLAVESLEAGREDGGGGRLAVAAVHVRLDGVDAGGAAPLPGRAVVVAAAVLLGLLQRLGQQGLGVGLLLAAVGVLELPLPGLGVLAGGDGLVAGLHPGVCPGVPVPVVPPVPGLGVLLRVAARQQPGAELPRPGPRPLGQRRVLGLLPLLVVGERGAV